jgi:hypothetical protein
MTTGPLVPNAGPLQKFQCKLSEVRSAVVDRGTCYLLQHPVGDVGRSGNLQEMPSTVSGHYTQILFCAMRWHAVL